MKPRIEGVPPEIVLAVRVLFYMTMAAALIYLVAPGPSAWP